MVSINDGPTAGAAGATYISTSVSTGVAGAGAGCKGTVGTTATANAVAAIGATATVAASNGAGSAGAPRATGTSTATAVMVGTTKAGTNRTTGKAIKEYSDKTQERLMWIFLRSAQIIPFRIPSLRRIS